MVRHTTDGITIAWAMDRVNKKRIIDAVVESDNYIAIDLSDFNSYDETPTRLRTKESCEVVHMSTALQSVAQGSAYNTLKLELSLAHHGIKMRTPSQNALNKVCTVRHDWSILFADEASMATDDP